MYVNKNNKRFIVELNFFRLIFIDIFACVATFCALSPSYYSCNIQCNSFTDNGTADTLHFNSRSAIVSNCLAVTTSTSTGTKCIELSQFESKKKPYLVFGVAIRFRTKARKPAQQMKKIGKLWRAQSTKTKSTAPIIILLLLLFLPQRLLSFSFFSLFFPLETIATWLLSQLLYIIILFGFFISIHIFFLFIWTLCNFWEHVGAPSIVLLPSASGSFTIWWSKRITWKIVKF